MTRILIAYGTVEGQTGKIAEHIGRYTHRVGIITTLFNTDKCTIQHITGKPNEPQLEEAEYNHDFRPDIDLYDGIVLGGPLHMGAYPKSVAGFIDTIATALSYKHTIVGFFTVCMAAADKVHPHKSLEHAQQVQSKYLAAHELFPDLSQVFAGALMYSQYGTCKSWMMQFIARCSGGNTDASRDYEYTDWQNVDTFADKFNTAVRAEQASRPQVNKC